MNSKIKEQKSVKLLDNIVVGKIYMVYLYQQKIYWPTKVTSVSHLGVTKNLSQTIRLQLYNFLDSFSKKPKQISINLKNTHSDQIIPFQSVYKSPNDCWKEIQEQETCHSKKFEKAMTLATQDYEARLKTPKMYNELKREYKNLQQKDSRIVQNSKNEPKIEYEANSSVSHSYSLRNRSEKYSNMSSLKSNSSKNIENLTDKKNMSKKFGGISKNQSSNRSNKFKQLKNNYESEPPESYVTSENQSNLGSNCSTPLNRNSGSISSRPSSIKSFHTIPNGTNQSLKGNIKLQVKENKKSNQQSKSNSNKKRTLSKVQNIIPDYFENQSVSKLGAPKKKRKNSSGTIKSQAVHNLEISNQLRKSSKFATKVQEKPKQSKNSKKIMKTFIYPQQKEQIIEENFQEKSFISRRTRSRSGSVASKVDNLETPIVINSKKTLNSRSIKKEFQMKVQMCDKVTEIKANKLLSKNQLKKKKIKQSILGEKKQREQLVKLQKSVKKYTKETKLKKKQHDYRIIQQLYLSIQEKANKILNKHAIAYKNPLQSTKIKCQQQIPRVMHLIKPIRFREGDEPLESENQSSRQPNMLTSLNLNNQIQNRSESFELFLSRVLPDLPFNPNNQQLCFNYFVTDQESNQYASESRAAKMTDSQIVKEKQIPQKQSHLMQDFQQSETFNLRNDCLQAIDQLQCVFRSLRKKGLY